MKPLYGGFVKPSKTLGALQSPPYGGFTKYPLFKGFSKPLCKVPLCICRKKTEMCICVYVCVYKAPWDSVKSALFVLLLALVKIMLTDACIHIYCLHLCYYNNLSYYMHMCYMYTMVVHSGGLHIGWQLATCILSMIGYLCKIFILWQMHVHTYVY